MLMFGERGRRDKTACQCRWRVGWFSLASRLGQMGWSGVWDGVNEPVGVEKREWEK